MRVNRSRVAYRECRDREKRRGHDRGLGKCFGRFRKHPHGIRVRKVLENPGHTPAAESSGCCWRQCRAAVGEAAGVCWSWGWCSWRRPEGSGQCWRAEQCSSVGWHCSCAGTVARGYCSYAGTVAPDESKAARQLMIRLGWSSLEHWGSRRAAASLGSSRQGNV